VELEVLNNKHGRGLVLLNNKPALMLYFIVGLIKEQNLFLFIFFKLFMYFCLLIIYKNNKKKEKNKKSLQIKH
jgi:hypothetical protein